ncbi:ABC transporter permease [Microlunatus flavus]|uniref:Peptide/nickel transport system permease protein n=1 Tax=Microlunatus flavus TaxID=1036181 RepID=A0A1H9DUX2_9ACTN|nr:ABC transporter permease [Microlunatus flavus]SEQ16643.1 peptide/nickel transport system permease protein [Microlunatus flavus]
MTTATTLEPAGPLPSPALPAEPTASRARPWIRFVASRLLRLVVSLLVLVTATFVMVHLVPGDPVQAALGEQATPQLVELRRHELGLDQPLPAQYVHYLRGVVTGDLGRSIVTEAPVGDLLGTRFPNTLRLAVPAFVLVILIALPVGLLTAVRTRGGRGRVTRGVFVNVTGLFNSVPDYVMATVLSVVFVVGLKLFPAAGLTGPRSYVLPVAALVVGPAASLSRIVRVEALKVLDTEYVRAAKSRRLPRRLLYLRHVLPNMMTASLTFGAMILSGLVAGTVLVENVFGWPGVGTVISQAVIQKDFPLVQGVLLVLGAAVLLLNMVVDVLLGVLDPRSRLGALR